MHESTPTSPPDDSDLNLELVDHLCVQRERNFLRLAKECVRKARSASAYTTAAAFIVAFGTMSALAGEEIKTMCAEDCPAYMAHPDKGNLSLFDIQQLCAPDASVCILTNCEDKK